MDKLKVFTAFSGYDSQCMALDRLGVNYELVGWSEIDKYAIQAHNAIYPQWAYGFFWRYKDDSLYENAKQALDRKIKLSKESRQEKIAIKCGKPVEQYSKDGIFIARYPSTRHASESTGICRVSIINASNGKLNHAGGYIWKNA